MSFFQNVYNEYVGIWDLSKQIGKDTQINFKIKGKPSPIDLFKSGVAGPYDLSSDGNLTFNLSFGLEADIQISVDIAGSTASSTSVDEIVEILNSDDVFSTYFEVVNISNYVQIKQKSDKFKCYISNTGAELVLKFNNTLSIKDIPYYFNKDTVDFTGLGNDNLKTLVRLGGRITSIGTGYPSLIFSKNHGLTDGQIIFIAASNSDPLIDGEYEVAYHSDDEFHVDVPITTAGYCGEYFTAEEVQILSDAGINYLDLKKDWEHLVGISNIFEFSKSEVDGDDRVTSKIIYPAGSEVGASVLKTFYTYDGSNLTPSTEVTIPHVLSEDDLIDA